MIPKWFETAAAQAESTVIDLHILELLEPFAEADPSYAVVKNGVDIIGVPLTDFCRALPVVKSSLSVFFTFHFFYSQLLPIADQTDSSPRASVS